MFWLTHAYTHLRTQAPLVGTRCHAIDATLSRPVAFLVCHRGSRTQRAGITQWTDERFFRHSRLGQHVVLTHGRGGGGLKRKPRPQLEKFMSADALLKIKSCFRPSAWLSVMTCTPTRSRASEFHFETSPHAADKPIHESRGWRRRSRRAHGGEGAAPQT